jgi:sugar phosphate isomerase/epimerase
MDDAGLASIAVTTYTDLISPDPAVSRASVDEAAAHAELAAALGAPVIRVFLGERSDAADRATLTARAIDGLRALLERLGGTSVAVAIEPHDEHVAAKTIRPILEAIRDPRLGVVWDLGNACSIGEAPEVGLAAYAGRIAYVQVKDGTGSGPSWRLGDLGAGDVPLERAIHSLTASCATAGTDVPPISLEWERAWHDELAPAEVALPRAHAWLVEHLTPLAMRATMADAVDDR